MGYGKFATKIGAMPFTVGPTFRAFVAERVQQNMPHTAWQIECMACEYEWVGACISNPLYFECPQCHAVQGVRKERRDTVIKDVGADD